jgi:hypothetical protein
MKRKVRNLGSTELGLSLPRVAALGVATGHQGEQENDFCTAEVGKVRRQSVVSTRENYEYLC